MKHVIKSLLLASAAAVVLAPIQARADGFVTPWVGSAFGSNIQNGQATLGVSAGGGDVRYLRATSDLTTNVRSIDINGDRLHFWRASVGVVFR